MAKQRIKTADPIVDSGSADSIKTAFTKVNENFTELYTALGLSDDTVLSLGAFEFSGSTMTTTDSSGITIDQAVSVTSNLTVGGDILPQTANGGDLGSLTNPFRSLYVSTGTVYMGGVPLRIGPNNSLTVNGTQVGSSDTDRLTNNGQELVLDANGQLTFPGGPTFGDNILTGSAGSDLAIETEDGGSSKLWTFGLDGSTTFPNGAKLNNGTNLQFATDNTVTTSLDLRDTTGRGFYTGDDGFTLRSNGTYNWIFDPTGWLKVPANTGLLGVIDEDIKIRARDYDDDGFAVVQEVLDDQDAVLGQTNLRRDEFKVEFYDGSGNLISYNRFTPTYLEIEGDIQGSYGGSTSLLINGADSNSTVALKVIDNTDTVQSYISLKNNSIKLATVAGAKEWAFKEDGRTTFPAATVPAHSYGAAGDVAGMVAFDSGYIYYCTSNYVDNSTNIWKRVAFDATTW